MAAAARGARLASVSRARRRSTRRPIRTARAACITASATAAAATSTRRTRPRSRRSRRRRRPARLKVVTRAHVTTIEVDGDGRVTGVTYVTDGDEYFQPAKVVLLASYTYENVRLLLLSKSKAFPERAVEQPRSGRPALLQPQHRRAGVTALFPFEPQQLVRAAGAGRRGRRLGRRQLRSRRPRLHRRRQSLGLFGPAADRAPPA